MAAKASLFDEEPETPSGGPRASLFDDMPDAEVVDAGPAARRSAAGMTPGPREYTDEELGIDKGPLYTDPYHSRGGKPIVSEFPPGALDLDPTAQAVIGHVVGGAAGKAVGQLIPKVAPGFAAAAPKLAGTVLPAAAEGATAAKVQGGNPLVGALLGAAPSAASATYRAVRAGAPARVAARTVANLGEEATKKTASQLTQKAGEGGSVLAEVTKRNPDLRYALAVESAAKPEKALRAVDSTLARANTALDDGFAKMEAHFADKPASSQASVPQILDDIDGMLAKSRGDLDRSTAIRAARKAIVDEFGDAPGTTITPRELRALKQTIGRRAFSGDTTTPKSVKAQIASELYRPVARQLAALAEATPGLDAKEFVALNRDVATLIPVQQSLKEAATAKAASRKGLLDYAKHGAHTIPALVGGAAFGPHGLVAGAAATAAAKGAGRALRRIDYGLSERAARAAALGEAPSVLERIPGATPATIVQQLQEERDRDAARR